MPANTSEIGIRELREGLSDVLMETAVRGRVTYITNRGKRMVGLVPLPVAEAAEESVRNAAIVAALRDADPDLYARLAAHTATA